MRTNLIHFVIGAAICTGYVLISPFVHNLIFWLAPIGLFGIGMMMLALEALTGKKHETLLDFWQTYILIPSGVLVGLALSFVFNQDLSTWAIFKALLALPISFLSVSAAYYASRYPKGNPFLKYEHNE